MTESLFARPLGSSVRRFATLVIFAALWTLGNVSIRAQSQLKRDVDLTANDGIKLKATYFAATKPGPAIMLLHMCGDANRKTWDDLGSKLAADGFHVLALDYRGYGESGDTPSSQQDSAAEKVAEAKWPFDIDIGLAYLLAQPGVTGKSIGVGGASCGVENSVALAVRHPGATRAMEVYRSSKSRHPDATPFPVNATIFLGDERLKSGNLWDALQFFKLSVEAYPNSTYAHYRLAQAYQRQGNRRLSVSITEHALQLVEKDNMSDETRDYFRETIRKLLAELGATPSK